MSYCTGAGCSTGSIGSGAFPAAAQTAGVAAGDAIR
jgi:hypothetical protein